jgi:hypothetical protein
VIWWRSEYIRVYFGGRTNRIEVFIVGVSLCIRLLLGSRLTEINKISNRTSQRTSSEMSLQLRRCRYSAEGEGKQKYNISNSLLIVYSSLSF